MNPAETGKKYDKIAQWWHDQHYTSAYGLLQIKRAISYCKGRGAALDVGCGSGGRVVNALISAGFKGITGIDLSEKMIGLAKANHPDVDFQVQDICSWQAAQTYDFIVAWDSIFHVPLHYQALVVAKLCQLLNPEGILIYTFGDASGEHLSNWQNDQFYYSTIGIDGNLKAIMDNNCQCRHLELDQFPENHVYVIVQKQ
ncbi:class I SAM-dependent methyltransferase [Pontibacter fetidus]|uniref:Class I SAM-dependent methyltransferase n=1 Tax=Pontibacter fetidus TaxID=2700082 RepID=A0A6B2H1R1_9BACT|nr:class I SAM-dependent methyltransferase [Pontibacter fetidus]NDK54556.1 class I SAM-dependent methyltransferase [Pontibacter fetidus]